MQHIVTIGSKQENWIAKSCLGGQFGYEKDNFFVVYNVFYTCVMSDALVFNMLYYVWGIIPVRIT